MTVADVAIEPQKGDKKTGATPPGTLPIIPPDPAHMAIQGLGSFADDTGGQAKRDKEYEVSSSSKFGQLNKYSQHISQVKNPSDEARTREGWGFSDTCSSLNRERGPKRDSTVSSV